MIIPDSLIKQWASNGGVTPFVPENVNSASIDLTWSGLSRRSSSSIGSLVMHETKDSMTLFPGSFYLLDTTEYVKIPRNWCGLLMLKSSIARLGIEHLHAGFFDPEFEGTATLELHVVTPWPVRIDIHQRIVQLVLMQMLAEPDEGYAKKGRYVGQRGPTEARGGEK